jgi:hypothetical protein
LTLTVKVPTGMTEADLARPLVEVRDFESGAVEYEIYTFGEENVVVPVSKLAKGAVIVIALFMALQQVGVAEEIVTAAFTLILGAAALAVGLAFGLGNRELAGEITRRWYEGAGEGGRGERDDLRGEREEVRSER